MMLKIRKDQDKEAGTATFGKNVRNDSWRNLGLTKASLLDK